jgi:hypothetical protein
MLLNLTTKVALMVTALGKLAGTRWHRYLIYTFSNGARERLDKTHDYRKVRKRTDYRCSTSPGSIRVIVFIFPQGRHYCKDDQINSGERLGKEL